MIDITDKEKCCGCYGCYSICPANAIEMKEDKKGFKYPIINKEKCINCNLCEKICPIINKKNVNNNPKAYAAYNIDSEVRFNSSSGGIFSLLAEKILENNGVVFGATFDKNFMVYHRKIKSIGELELLRTSKYVQSVIGETYKECKEELENGKNVLFTGTPCQINGLYKYLQRKYDNLYTQDIICHGVPSPKVWRKYLEFRRKKDAKQPVRINFRHKENGWNLYALLLQYNNSAYKTNHSNDLFMQAFLRNACLRDSCYNCSFKDKNRISDITLADFWGIDKISPKMNDNKGTSLVIINSIKGQKIFDSISKKMKFEEVNFEESIKYNLSMTTSASKHKSSEEFFENLDALDFDVLVKKYSKDSDFILIKVLRKFKRVVEKLKNKGKMSESLVSVIIPCYNVENKMIRFMESMLSQTYKKLELIFVDDGSTDKTKDVIYQYKERFENNGYIFKYIYQKNSGVGCATNEGLKNITGEYLVWIDPDDWLNANSIEKRLKFLNSHKEYSIVMSNGNMYNSTNLNKIKGKITNIFNINNYKKNQFELLLRHKSIFIPGCYMIRVSSLKEVNPTLEIYQAREGQNFQMLLPICYKYNRYFMKECLFNYVIYNDSLSRGDDTVEKVEKRQEGLKKIVINTILKMDIPNQEKEYYIEKYTKFSEIMLFNGFYAIKNKNKINESYKKIKANKDLNCKVILKYFLSKLNIFLSRK